MTSPGVFQLFVYGSLRNGFHNPMYEYISRHFKFLGPAKVKGKLFNMGDYPAGVPASEDVFITGELYVANSNSEFDWAIGQLDDYEGVTPEQDEPQLYRREMAEIFINGNTTPAWIYWYNGDISGKPLIASGDMMEYMKEKK
jgi:gamma-glutamylcyclotransferase (GGCT)/AIG2-like uncharacterized protein YtfP